jgi:hypothetical protein
MNRCQKKCRLFNNKNKAISIILFIGFILFVISKNKLEPKCPTNDSAPTNETFLENKVKINRFSL